MLDMVHGVNVLGEDEVTYLYLPLAHSFALLIQFGTFDLGATLAYCERDPLKILPNLAEVQPTYFPSVPRMFEKIYSLAISNAPDKAQLEQAVQLGMKVRQMQARGETVPPELQEAFDKADAALFQNVRNIFGGRIKQAVTGYGRADKQQVMEMVRVQLRMSEVPKPDHAADALAAAITHAGVMHVVNAAARARASRWGTSRPVSSSMTSSARPEMSVATTGVCVASASKSASGIPSILPLSVMIDGSTKTSDSPRSSSTRWRGCAPSSWTRSPIPRRPRPTPYPS